MADEITPDQLSQQEQKQTAQLLRSKIQQGPQSSEIIAARFGVDDAINLLQLALVAHRMDVQAATQAINLVHNWLSWLANGNYCQGHMLQIFDAHEQIRVQQLISEQQMKLRVCERMVLTRQGFHIDAIDGLRQWINKPLRLMCLFLRQRDVRRRELREIARHEFLSPNRAQALVNTVAAAIRIVDRQRTTAIDGRVSPERMVMLDLFAVIVGRDMLGGRLQGAHYGGTHSGSGGFKPELADVHYQAQHAFAGIWIGYEYGTFGKLGAMFLEWWGEEPQDVECYRVTAPLGQELSRRNYHELPRKLARAIGDNTVTAP